MTGLVDIAPISRKVEIGGQTYTVYGVSALGAAVLIDRFTELRMLLEKEGASIDAETMIKLGPEVVNAVVAAGLGAPGDEKAEQAIGLMGLGSVVELITPILELTLPKGLPDFLKAVGAAARHLGLDVDFGPAEKSPSPSKS